MNDEPPPLELPRQPKFGFGAQVSFGAFAVLLLVAFCWALRNTTFPRLCLQVVPLVAIVGCFFRATRGYALGVLLVLGLSLIALIGVCFATFKI